MALLAAIGIVDVGVAPHGNFAAAGAEIVAGRELANAGEARALAADGEEVEKEIEAAPVRLRLDQPGGEQSLDLRGPQQPAVGLRVEQRRNAGAVAAEQ